MEPGHGKSSPLRPDRNAARNRAFTTPEGRILLCGLLLSLVYFVFLAVSYFISTQNFQVFTGMTATNILFGRAAGMSFGYALGFGHLVVLPVNLAVETIMVLLVYPLFVFGWRNLLVFRTLNNFMRRIEKAAMANQDIIRRYGIPSLFLFVLVPFWMTGPVIGCVIGFFLGIRPCEQLHQTTGVGAVQFPTKEPLIKSEVP